MAWDAANGTDECADPPLGLAVARSLWPSPKTLLVEDHAMVRERLLLLDLDLPDSRGLDTLARVRAAAPWVPVVVLSACDDRDSVLAANDHGAAGFLSKTVDAAQLVDGVRRVLEGGVVLPAVLSRGAVEPGVLPEFSQRQRDVLRLLIDGQSNKLIARGLGLTDATVKTHLQLIYRKMGVESRTQAVLAAARWRLRL